MFYLPTLPMLSRLYRVVEASAQRFLKLGVILMSMFTLQACSTTSSNSITHYDWGYDTPNMAATPLATSPKQQAHQQTTAQPLNPSLILIEANTLHLYQDQSMYFRLLYEANTALKPYATHRWLMPPTQMLGEKIKSYLQQHGWKVLNEGDGVKHLPILKYELEELAQHFTSPQQCHIVLNWRASFIHQQKLLAQRGFQQSLPCSSPDALGGVVAIQQAAQKSIQDMREWLAREARISP